MAKIINITPKGDNITIGEGGGQTFKCNDPTTFEEQIKCNKTILSNNFQGIVNNMSSCPIYIIPRWSYKDLNLSDSKTESFLKELLKKICETYPNVTHAIFIGLETPSAIGPTIIHIYSTNDLDNNNFPRYSSGIHFHYGRFSAFGTWDYLPYYYPMAGALCGSDSTLPNASSCYGCFYIQY